MLIAVRWLQLKMPWKWQPRLCLKLVVAPILMLICNDLIFAAKMSWNLLGCLSWTIGKSRISARIWFCLRLGVETGAVEERLASIRRMLSVRLWDVDRAAERIQTKDIWFILMYSHGFQHDLATPHGKNRRIWKIRRERERERESLPIWNWFCKIRTLNTKVRVVWDQAVRFCLLPLRVSVAGMSCVSGIVGSRGFAPPHSRL